MSKFIQWPSFETKAIGSHQGDLALESTPLTTTPHSLSSK